ncbi:hypothetical protein ACFYZI_34070 [Streptomyces griseorubiginosus]|uniref:Uncharacterized protein n=1 Tax=Streptomyces griseorubiginosus TaxID=67304 RepID=A0A101RYV2_9ACTN|nr:hypothetical protein [Streptomyces griseorubiginosus]KUN64297.1 hypothetical protein AQJ54_25095 [Streptomyces griseorubiginosus]
MNTADLTELILPRLDASTATLSARLRSDGLEAKRELGHYTSRRLALCAYASFDDGAEEGTIDLMLEVTERGDGGSIALGIYRESGRIIIEAPPIEVPGEFTAAVSAEVMDEFDTLIDQAYALIVSEIRGTSAGHSDAQ